MFERVYEAGPVFRAEPHDTDRHLAKNTSLDAELGFITDHREVMAVLRHAVAGMVAVITETRSRGCRVVGGGASGRAGGDPSDPLL